MVKKLSVAALKANLSEALRDVEGGTRIVVERRGQPVAVLVPADDAAMNTHPWWQDLYGIVAEVADFDAIMHDIVRSRRKSRPRPVKLED
jgi:prevent-host-death family protein